MFPIAGTLIAIGLIISVLGTSFALSSLQKKEITEKIHDNEQISFSPRRDKFRRFSLIVPLKHKCSIHVQLNPTAGPFDFHVQDFIGFPISLPVIDWAIKPYYVAKGLPRGEPVSFTLDLEPGNYSFVFNAKGYVEAITTVTSTATYVVRPLERFLDVGLHLLEIGMPVLITGLVLFIGQSTL